MISLSKKNKITKIYYFHFSIPFFFFLLYYLSLNDNTKINDNFFPFFANKQKQKKENKNYYKHLSVVEID